MYILYLHQYFCPPGAAGNTRSLDFARAWAAEGHKVIILTSPAYFPEDLRQPLPDWAMPLEDGVNVHVVNVPYAHMMSFPQRILAFLRFYRRGIRYAKNLPRPDVIYASSTPPSVGEMGRKLAQHWGVPFVFETVDVWPDVPIGMGIIRNSLLIKWLRARVWRIYNESAHVVTLSEGMQAQVLKAGVPKEKITVVHNGTDPRAFAYVERPARPKVHCVYSGTVGIANGVEAIVDAAAAIEARGRHDIAFTILGGGNALEEVKRYAATKKLRNLTFQASIPKEEVPAFLAQADIGLVTFAPFPVLEANSANKFYDYLACGLPVVIDYEGWQAGYLAAHQCGLSSPMGAGAVFVQNILRLADDPSLRATMGRNGRKLVEARWDRRDLAATVLALLQAATKKARS